MNAPTPSPGERDARDRRESRTRPGGPPFINNLPREVLDRFEAEQNEKRTRYPDRWPASLRETVHADRERPAIQVASDLGELLDPEPPTETDHR